MNYDNLGIEYDSSISNDQEYISQIIERDLSFADENITWDFNEEVRATLDSKFRFSDSRWLGGCIGFILLGLMTMVILNAGWLIVLFFCTIGFFFGKYMGKQTIHSISKRKYVLEELYIGYFESIVDTLEFKSDKFNDVDLNIVRLVLEMALQKFTLALNYQNVRESKQLKRAVHKFRKLLLKKIFNKL